MIAPNSLLAGLIDHLWQSSGVGLGILGLISVCRHGPASLRKQLAGIGLAKFLVPASLLRPAIGLLAESTGHWDRAFAFRGSAAVAPGMLVVQAGGAKSLLSEAGLVLLVIWAIGTATALLLACVRTVQFRRKLSREASGLSPSLAQALASFPLQGQGPFPKALSVPPGSTPGLLGIVHPILLLPSDLDGNLDSDELRTVIAHEWVHLRERDNLKTAGQFLVFALFWFNPVVWLLSRAFRLETERACDERVVALTSRPESYASALLKLVRIASGAPSPVIAAAIRPPIARRIRAILNPETQKLPPLMKSISLLLASSLFAVALTLSANGDVAQPHGIRVYDLQQLDHAPAAIAQPRPVYPANERANHVSGKATVDFLVKADGTVVAAHAISSSLPQFEKPAVDSVKQWTFKPGVVSGNPVCTHMQVTIVFEIPGNGS